MLEFVFSGMNRTSRTTARSAGLSIPYYSCVLAINNISPTRTKEKSKKWAGTTVVEPFGAYERGKGLTKGRGFKFALRVCWMVVQSVMNFSNLGFPKHKSNRLEEIFKTTIKRKL